MAHDRPFHETLTEVTQSYGRARLDLERAMLGGNQQKIADAFSRVQEIESCVQLNLKRPLPR